MCSKIIVFFLIILLKVNCSDYKFLPEISTNKAEFDGWPVHVNPTVTCENCKDAFVKLIGDFKGVRDWNTLANYYINYANTDKSAHGDFTGDENIDDFYICKSVLYELSYVHPTCWKFYTQNGRSPPYHWFGIMNLIKDGKYHSIVVERSDQVRVVNVVDSTSLTIPYTCILTGYRGNSFNFRNFLLKKKEKLNIK